MKITQLFPMSYLLYTTIFTEFAIPKRSIHSNFINGKSFIYIFSLPPFSFHTYSLFLLSIYYRFLFPTLTTHKYAHARFYTWFILGQYLISPEKILSTFCLLFTHSLFIFIFLFLNTFGFSFCKLFLHSFHSQSSFPNFLRCFFNYFLFSLFESFFSLIDISSLII